MTIHRMANEENFDELHWEIIEILREGRGTPSYLATRTGESRQLISKRLRDLQMADVVQQIHRGLYELVPEEVPDRN
jgi:predicted HTH transcriptional regulator